MYHANSDQKRTGVDILISDKVGFKTILLPETSMFYNNKRVSPLRHNNYIYEPKNRALKHIKQKMTEVKGKQIIQHSNFNNGYNN